MKKRSLIFIGVLILLVAGVGLYPWRWVVLGFVRNESYFGDRPTSYWRQEIIAYDNADNKSESFWTEWLDYLGSETEPQLPAVLDGWDHGALAVQIELLEDSDAQVRFEAMRALRAGRILPYPRGISDSEAQRLVPALIKALDDRKASDARETTINDLCLYNCLDTLATFGPAASEAVPKLKTMLNAEDDVVRCGAAKCLWKITGNQEPSKSVLKAVKLPDVASRTLEEMELENKPPPKE